MKLLLIDDQIDIIRCLKEAIEPNGHECLIYQNPKDAIKEFNKEHFDVVITDIKMQTMNGIEVLKAIQKIKPNTPVILLTGYADTNNSIEALNNGAFAFFRKPINLKMLFATLAEIEEKIKNYPTREMLCNRLIEENEVLLREIHHRVKNNLQVINSLLKLQCRQIQNQEAIEVLNETYCRILSMALVHEKLYDSENFASLNLAKYIHSLTNDVHIKKEIKRKQICLDLELNSIYVSIDSAVPWGLIINELICTAMKYFIRLKNNKNRIRIILRRNGKNRIELIVNYHGICLPEDFDLNNTNLIGLHIVSIIANDQLHCKIKVEHKNKTNCRIILKENAITTID
jgi:two-component sensor histidine kinase